MKKLIGAIVLVLILYFAAGFLYRMQASSKLAAALQTDVVSNLQVQQLSLSGQYLFSNIREGEATIAFSELREQNRGMEDKTFQIKVRIDGRLWPINVGYYDVAGAEAYLNREALMLLNQGTN